MNEHNRAIWKRVILSLSIGAALCSLVLFKYYRDYPHGLRSGKLTTFTLVLHEYAIEHDGWCPKGGATPLASLQKLYPLCDAAALAGMSGNERKAREYFESGRTIDETVSSWVYFPGFRTNDNPGIAIIWEREEGIFITVQRSDGYAVGFVGCGYDQIPSKDWPAFLKRQEELQKETLVRRGQ